MTSSLAGLLFVAMFGFVYLLPAIVAFELQRRNKGAIFTLNLLLGWTFIGWVVALVWAMTKDATAAVEPQTRP